MEVEKGDGNTEQRDSFLLAAPALTVSAPVLNAAKSAKLLLNQTPTQPPLLPYSVIHSSAG